MLKRITLALLCSAAAWAQITPPALTQSTLTSNASAANVALTLSFPFPFVPTGTLPGMLYVDSEAMTVVSASLNLQQVTVQRGARGTTPALHYAGAVVFSGGPAQFIAVDKSGACDPNSPQLLNVADQKYFTCTAGNWVSASTAPTSGGGGPPTGAAGGNLSGTYPNPGLSQTAHISAANLNNSTAISAWGDSLTLGNQDGSGHSYPSYLQASLNRAAGNFGVSGQTSTGVAARFLVSPNTWNNYTLIWVGRNNIGQQSQILSDIASMVAHVPNGRYLILGVINNETEPSGNANYNLIVAINSALAAAYPSNYIDIRSLLVTQFNPANGADVADHASDIPPYSLRAINAVGTLAAAITDTTSCPVLSGAPGNAGGILHIDSEYIVILGVSGNTVTSCTRGYGSTAATHLISAPYTIADYEHLGATGYSYVASQASTFINAHDPMAGSISSAFPYDSLNNLSIGNAALNSNTTGQLNQAIGNQALLSNTTGNQNSAFGALSLNQNNSGSQNNAFGYFALNLNTTGATNNAFGNYALGVNSTGSDNDAFGYQALFANTGAQNSAFGSFALTNNAASSFNSAFGFQSLGLNSGGQDNTAVGYQAGYGSTSANANTSGSNNTFLGYQASPGSAVQQAFLSVIGAGATGTCSNCVVLGRSSDVVQVPGKANFNGNASTDSIVKIGTLEVQPNALNNASICENLYWNGTVITYRAAGSGACIQYFGNEVQMRLSPIGGIGPASQTVVYKANLSSSVGTVVIGGHIGSTNGDLTGGTLTVNDTSTTSAKAIGFASYTFATLPASPVNGWMVYCSDCKNVTDNTTGTFDSVAASGGNGTNVLRENGSWRVH